VRLENINLLPQLIVFLLVFTVFMVLRNMLVKKINFSNIERLAKSGSGRPWGALITDALKIIAVLLLCAALLRPQEVKTETKDNIKGIDIMLALDISGSMQADDLKPDRVGAAKEVLRQFVSGLVNDRAGLVVFAGTSFSQCPLTTDYEIVRNFIDQVDLSTIRIDGTAIGDAIITAVNRLEKSGPTKVIILTTDGANNRGVSPVEAAKIAAYKGIKIYTIGIGKKGGSPMMQMGYDGQKHRVINQYTGQPMNWEEPDENTLTQMAEQTGGQYFRATDNRALKQIYETIGKLEKQDIQVKTYNKKIDKFKWFLWAGLALLLLAFGLEVFKYTRVVA
jgi:Ca-activated chloride channel family protein